MSKSDPVLIPPPPPLVPDLGHMVYGEHYGALPEYNPEGDGPTIPDEFLKAPNHNETVLEKQEPVLDLASHPDAPPMPDAALAAPKNDDKQPTPMGTPASPLLGHVDYVKYWGDKYNYSAGETSTALTIGIAKDMEAAYKATLDNAQTQAQFKANNLDPIEAQHGFDLVRLVGEGASTLPVMKQIITNQVAGGAIGASGGAAVGLLGGPAAPVTVPGGAMAGLALGSTSAAFVTAANIAKGGAYAAMRQAGLDKESAKNASTAIGAVSGIINSLQLGSLTKVGQQAAMDFLRTAPGTDLVKKGITSYLGQIATQGSFNAANVLANDSIQYAAAYLSGKPGASPQPNDIAKHVVQGLLEGAAFGAVAGPVTHSVGHVIGSVFPHKQPATPQEHSANILALAERFNPHTETATGVKLPALEEEAPKLDTRTKKEIARYEAHIEINTQLKAATREREQAERARNSQEKKINTLKAEKALGYENFNDEKFQKAKIKLEEVKQNLEGAIENEDALLENAKELEKESKSIANTKIKKLLGQITDVLNGPKAESKFDLESRQALFAYKTFINTAKDKTAEKFLLGEIEKHLEQAKTEDAAALKPESGLEIPDTDLATEIKKIAAGDTVGYSEMDSNQLVDLGNKIKELITTGKDKRIAKKQAQDAEFKKVLSSVIENLQGTKPVNLKDTNLREPSGPLHWFTRTKGETMYPWDSLMDNIFIDSKNRNASDLLDAQTPILAEQASIAEQQEIAMGFAAKGDKTLHGKVSEILTLGAEDKYVGGKATVNKLTGKLSDKDAPKYTTQDGVELPLRMSDNEAMQWHIDFQRPSMEQGIREGNKFTFKDNEKNTHKLLEGEVSTEELIEKNLTEDQKRVAEGIRDYYNSDRAFNRLNKKSKEVFDIPLERDENYTGYRGRLGFEGPEEGSSEFFAQQLFAGRKSLIPKSTISKVRSQKGYVNVDIADNLARAISTNESWIHTSDTANLIRKVFRNKEVREIIKLKQGTNSLKIIDYMYNNLFGTRGIQHVQKVKLIGILRKNAATAFVAGKLNAVKQLSSMWNAFNYISGPQLASGTIKSLTNPKHAYDVLSKTDLWKTRYAKNGSGMITEAMERKDKLGLKGDGNTIPFTMGLTTFFDKTSMLLSGYAVYDGAKANAIKAGMAPEAAHIQGLKEFEKFGNRTSSSSTPDQMTFWEKGGDYQKLYMLFGKSQAQNIAHGDIALRRFISNPTPENRNQAVNTVLGNIASQVTYASIFAIPSAIWAVVNQDPKADQLVRNTITEVSAAALLNQYSGFGLFGSLMNSALIEALNHATHSNSKVWEPNDVLSSTGTHAYFFGHYMIQLLSKGHLNTEDTFKALEHFARSAELINPYVKLGGGGFPVSPLVQGAHALVDARNKSQ